MVQGSDPSDNITFRAERYSLDYPAFEGRDLTPNGTVELDPAAVFEFRQAGGKESEVTLTWSSLPDETYHLRHAAFLGNPIWSSVSTQQAIGTLTHFTDTDDARGNQSQSFYQVVAEP